MDGIRVLVVDDHAILRDGIRAFLGRCTEIEVVGEAANGREALDGVRQLSPDVVLMDVAMPIMGGLEATLVLSKKHPGVKVIALTQCDEKDCMLSAIESGAWGYIPKSAVGADLLTAILAVHRGDMYIYPPATRALVEEYLRCARSRGGQDPYDSLTGREREVLKLVAEGRSNSEVAGLLGLSTRTVAGHRAAAMSKLGLHNRADLIKCAARRGIIDLRL